MRKTQIICAAIILATLVCSSPSPADSVPDAYDKTVSPPPVVEYNIDARLLPANRKLEATEILTWRNKTSNPAKYLRFHLYYNAFRGPLTTFMKEGGFVRKNRAPHQNDRRFGGIDILEVHQIGGGDLAKNLTYPAVDDGNTMDRTVMEIPLEKPVAPGELIRLRIRFRLEIPDIFARTGCWKDYFFMGQWFPKIGVFQQDGSWNCHQFHAFSEFFADFGHYHVAITLPERFIVGATGNQTEKTTHSDGTVTYTFSEKRIHDFAWTAWPHFQELKRRVAVPGRSDPVQITLLLSPHHDNAREPYFNSLIFAMKYFSTHLFPYPYDGITVVDPPFRGQASGGMEYPTLITGGHISFLPEGFHLTEMTTIHEFGHQYWYGIVASDEFREAWLDEGVNTFFEAEIMEAYFGRNGSFLDLPFLKIRDDEIRRLSMNMIRTREPVNQRSWLFLNGQTYSAHVYSKAAVFLNTLKGFLGKEKLYDFFRQYARRFAWQHPTTRDFIATLNETTGLDLGWAFTRFINGSGRLDLAIHSVTSEQLEKEPIRFRNEVTLIRNEGFFPAEVLIRLENGREIRHLWKDRGAWKRLTFTHESPVETAIIDPDFRIPLDHNLSNNSMRASPDTREARGKATRLGFLFQNLLSALFM